MKFLRKRYLEWWENEYLTVKNSGAFRVLRKALDPSQLQMAHFAYTTLLCSIGKISEIFPEVPLDQILYTLLEKKIDVIIKESDEKMFQGKRISFPRGIEFFITSSLIISPQKFFSNIPSVISFTQIGTFHLVREKFTCGSKRGHNTHPFLPIQRFKLTDPKCMGETKPLRFFSWK